MLLEEEEEEEEGQEGQGEEDEEEKDEDEDSSSSKRISRCLVINSERTRVKGASSHVAPPLVTINHYHRHRPHHH